MMHRRGLLAGLACGAAAAVPAAAGDRPRLAVTIDDFRFDDGPLVSADTRHHGILDALYFERIKAAGFVTGKHVETVEARAHLQSWAESGHFVANHTYSHAYYGGAAPGDLGADVDRAAALIVDLPTWRPWFRFPYLAEGRTAESRDRMREVLHTRGLMNGHVTVDASDWYVNQRLLARLEKEPGADVMPYGAYLVRHLLDRAAFYDGLARAVLGRSPAHTLLIHHNLTTALFLPMVLKAFRDAGWSLIDADEAFADPVFAARPNIAPCGHSLIHQLATEAGGFADRLRTPGEDGPYEAPAMDALGL
ncbi:MAG TPA: polysaccharide deacetylase family protein [Brevundimonas sp.]|jgi:peptidoglycan/xylan/chitin deacetylase (PgdA/CDA1 family)|uniref:polysaccharide deacetylase family protein n=1 Tax=Brevundimonas sp. TaxID=1871086 RepID=UPI002DE5115F|nr:polysaccharide deacetylase family protein [Brevundimonas sp.]